jgi:hypothetical protein
LSLFQKVIVKKYLKNLSSDLIEENYKRYSKYFNDFERTERIRTLKEEQYQEGFLRELFVDCLDYTINPNKNFNLTTEFKNKTDAEKADGAILKEEKPIAVIELKSTKTKDLRTIEKQAFNYKTHQSNCKYVITSNFEKIRLYINDATEFEEFNVFQLTKDEFKYFYLCFSKDSIFEDTPAIIKEKSNQHEEQISKKLYNDYSDFRNKIFQNLTKNNPQFDKLILFKKSQKLLDRFLFIFFAEDKGLIPANMISKIIDEFNKLKEMDHYTPLFSEFKRFFGYINKGNPKYQIDEYNGGLFQFDEILDNVKIDDEILIDDSLKLSNYDFDSEIDVNILGHIFEHSLTDIEKLNAEICGENLDKKQTRRKKEGVFYTPNYITKYIVENTVGALCNEKKNELKLNNLEIDETYFKKAKKSISKKGEQLFDKLENYKEWLLSLKILDPACGSGAFLNQALNFLIDEHNFIINLETDLRKGQLSLFDIDTAVLENNLYGVDINEESIEIAKLSLWLKTAKKGRKLTDLSHHIKCGNSLIDDTEIDGEKAFDWHKEFPEIMQNGGFDVVIGNPPYVVIKGGRWVGGFQYDKKSITYLKNKFVASSQQINTYILFLELGLKLTRDGGLISQITPNTFLTNEYSQKLRTLLIKYSSIKEFFKSESAFEDASVETVITTYRNTKISKQIIDVKLLNFNEGYNLNLSEIINFTEDSKYLIYINKKSIPLLKKLSRIDKVRKYAKVWRGLTTGDDKKYLSFKEETNLHKPIISGSEIERYYLKENTKFVYYVSELLDRPRDERIFLLNEKLISKFVGKKLTFCYDNHQHYVINTACSIELIDKNVNLYFLLTILNSKLINFYFQQIFSDNRDTFPIMKSGNIESLPMKYISSNKQQPFIEKADLMFSLNKQKHERINKFLYRLETNFEIEKFSKKINAFYDYDFKTLISELKKKKIKLTFSQQDEFEEYFNNFKEKINQLQSHIDKTDNEIDQMVYELYSLTEEEIEIVENG